MSTSLRYCEVLIIACINLHKYSTGTVHDCLFLSHFSSQTYRTYVPVRTKSGRWTDNLDEIPYLVL